MSVVVYKTVLEYSINPQLLVFSSGYTLTHTFRKSVKVSKNVLVPLSFLIRLLPHTKCRCDELKKSDLFVICHV